jgi:hypothetical protein
MLWESVNSMRRAAKNNPVPLRKPGQHNWVHRLPFKMRFKRSKIYLSIIPVIALGFAIGILTSVMGVGGGFIMVPAMIYLLRIPTNVVIGTSLFQIIFVTAFTTVVQATTNYSVDIVLAWLLMIAGVIGAQYGVRVGQKMRGEQLRAGLALLVLAVGIRLGIGLILPPDEIYSVVTGSFGVLMRALVALSLLLMPVALVTSALPAAAQIADPTVTINDKFVERIDIGISTNEIAIASDFSGADITVFGAIDGADELLLSPSPMMSWWRSKARANRPRCAARSA